MRLAPGLLGQATNQRLQPMRYATGLCGSPDGIHYAGVRLWENGKIVIVHGKRRDQLLDWELLIPSSRMLKKSASGLLASLRGSTYRSVRLASSLAAALLDSLFEHPEAIAPSTPIWKVPTTYCA